MKQQRISGKEAARVAEDMAKPGPIRVVEPREVQEAPGALVPSAGSELDRKVPPRVRKPLPRNDQWKAPTPDLGDAHRIDLHEPLAGINGADLGHQHGRVLLLAQNVDAGDVRR